VKNITVIISSNEEKASWEIGLTMFTTN